MRWSTISRRRLRKRWHPKVHMPDLVPRKNQLPTTQGNRLPLTPPSAQRLTNAATIYGLGGVALYGFAFYNLANANWFNGLLLLVPATSLAFLAYRYMR